MGEEQWRIHIVGEPTTEDNLWNNDHVSRLRELLGHRTESNWNFALVCLHPSPFEGISAKEMVDILVAGLEDYSGTLLVTPPNQDIGGSDIHQRFKELAHSHPTRIRYVQTLGKGLFNAALNHADFIIGNSSAGLLDATQFQLAAVNLGIRQKGRESSPRVAHIPFQKEKIKVAIQSIERLLRSKKAQLVKKKAVSASSKIADVLAGSLDRSKLLNKKILFGKDR
jgi:UDP-N-acetylglucosamine 2-epimerase